MAADGGGRLGALAGALHLKIEGGGTLSEALGGLDTRVPAGHAALIEAGESSGRLDETLAEIIAEEKGLTEARRRLLQRLAYPLLICCLAFLLPFLYLVLQGRTGEYLLIQSYFFVPLALLFLALHYRREIFPRGSSRRCLVEQVVLSLPLVGGLVRQYALAGVLQLLGRLLQAGLGFSDGLPLVRKAAGLRGLSRQLGEMAARIAGGSSATEGLGCIENIPADLRSRLASGDVSGTLDRALIEVGGPETHYKIPCEVKISPDILADITIRFSCRDESKGVDLLTVRGRIQFADDNFVDGVVENIRIPPYGSGAPMKLLGVETSFVGTERRLDMEGRAGNDGASLGQSGRHPRLASRLPSGELINRIVLQWHQTAEEGLFEGVATISLVDDIEALRLAIQKMAEMGKSGLSDSL